MVYGQVGFQRVAELASAVTGWDITVSELIEVGERAVNLARAFNAREGFTPQDDNMPQRFFTVHNSGPLEGVGLDSEAFRKARDAYYDMMGWPQGQPSPSKLRELGIDWVVPLLGAK